MPRKSKSPVEFVDTGVGWITPEGKVVGCTLYNHHQTLKDLPSVSPEFAAFMEEGDNKVRGVEEECQRLKDAGEHPEWHVYEWEQDKQKYAKQEVGNETD